MPGPASSCFCAAGDIRRQDGTKEGTSFYFRDADGHKLEVRVGDLDTRLAEMRRPESASSFETPGDI